MIEQIKKEIKILKMLSILLIIILFVFGWSAFFFNQYLNNIYNKQIKEAKSEGFSLQQKINKQSENISKLLNWKDLEKIKAMQSLYKLYFYNRYKVIPKDLIIELLEEILPSSAKVGNSIKMWENTDINLVLYTTNTKWLDTLYNKFVYYSKVLKLLDMKWFDTITLVNNNNYIRNIVSSNVKYVYRTTIQLKLNNNNLIKYYSLLYHPTSNYEMFKKIYWEEMIEPLKIPENITISDIVWLHKMYIDKYNLNEK